METTLIVMFLLTEAIRQNIAKKKKKIEIADLLSIQISKILLVSVFTTFKICC